MDWKEAISHFDVPKLYHDASIENCKMIKKSIVEKGTRWLNSKDRPSIFLSGSPGCGKTYLAYALFRGLVEEGSFWQIFIRSDQLDQELLDACMNNRESDVIAKYTEVPYLFWDDLGSERASERVLKQYYSIIESRISNQMSTVFTSNLSISDFYNPNKTNLGDRIASRLGLCYDIVFPSEDLRKKVKLLPL